MVGDTIAEESIDTEKYVTEAVIDVAFAEEQMMKILLQLIKYSCY